MRRAIQLPIIALLAILLAGCATFQNNAGKTIVTVDQTVNAAMQGWATFVVVSGTVPDSDQAKVRDAFTKYKACLATAQAAYAGLSGATGKDAITQALAALTASQAQLLQLLQTFNPPAK